MSESLDQTESEASCIFEIVIKYILRQIYIYYVLIASLIIDDNSTDNLNNSTNGCNNTE